MAPLTSQASQPTKHIVGFDLLRLAAIMLVLIFHRGFWGWASPDSVTVVNYGHGTDFPYASSLTHFGWVGVNIFFVLSGFLITDSAQGASAASFLKSRLVRLLPGFLICMTLAFLFLLAWGKIPEYSAVFLYITTILLLPFGPWIDGVLWTLSVEVAFYALVFWILKKGKLHRFMPLITCIGLISSLFWLIFVSVTSLNIASPENGKLLTTLAGSQFLQLLLIQNGCMFAFGAYVWFISSQKAKLKDYLIAIALSAGCLLAIYGESNMKAAHAGVALNPLTPICVWVAAMACLVIFIRYNKSLSSSLKALPMRNLGQATFLFYLLHENIGVLTFQGLITIGVPLWPALAINGILILAIGYILMLVAERPLQKRLKAYMG